ncbi:MAG: hypothetical protein J0H01_33980 [Rhizobiales bacterium]|nr:hypothetical protein [Hyphomicrobiales bacterium]
MRPVRINPEINIWSILATLCMVGAAGLWLQADVRDLKAEDARIQADIRDRERRVTRRLDAVEGRLDRTTEDVATIKGDIRVIRQILEGNGRPRTP